MLRKLLGQKGSLFLVEPGSKLEVRYEPPHFVLGDRPLTAASTAAHVLEPFVEERKKRGKPLVAHRQGDQLEVVLERTQPDRRYRLRIHPSRGTVAWSEELAELPDRRLPRLQPTWSRTFASPPWPARRGRTSLSAAWLPDGILFLLGDWLAWLEPATGKVKGEWPLPGKKGARATVELLTVVEQGVLGSYRVFEQEKPAVSGMLLLRLEDQPRWKLIPTRAGSVHLQHPVQPGPERIVVETRVYAGEDYLASRAQWVVDLAENQSYTALLGGPPGDQQEDRCLSLEPEVPNRLELTREGAQMVASNPVWKLATLPSFPSQGEPEAVRRGALWPGCALAYELTPERLQIYGWQDRGLDYVTCRACRARLPAPVYHCPCGMPWKP